MKKSTILIHVITAFAILFIGCADTEYSQKSTSLLQNLKYTIRLTTAFSPEVDYYTDSYTIDEHGNLILKAYIERYRLRWENKYGLVASPGTYTIESGAPHGDGTYGYPE